MAKDELHTSLLRRALWQTLPPRTPAIGINPLWQHAEEAYQGIRVSVTRAKKAPRMAQSQDEALRGAWRLSWLRYGWSSLLALLSRYPPSLPRLSVRRLALALGETTLRSPKAAGLPCWSLTGKGIGMTSLTLNLVSSLALMSSLSSAPLGPC